jgi:hypothetical protein
MTKYFLVCYTNIKPFIKFSVRIRIYRILGFSELKSKKSIENKRVARINFESSEILILTENFINDLILVYEKKLTVYFSLDRICKLLLL